MELIEDGRRAIDLTTTPLHLGLGSRARPIEGFAWDPAVLGAYAAAVAADGSDGRLLVIIDEEGRGDHWERHLGDEVVICLEGAITVVVEGSDGMEVEVALDPGQGTVNPAGAWHAVDVEGAGRILTITPGAGSEHRSRDRR
ncbi:MAG TPA: cupin domain-containing protein [Aquihabitans sp.]|jgi:mannose-6-phosphate isomerase-like protein (cupin superfamily)|nr:cupin domain-containing protein [Aquihabitans sp.]